MDGNSSLKPRIGDNIVRVSTKMQYMWDMFGERVENKDKLAIIERLKLMGAQR